jgi:predicted Co/Zn/Cd cation transporter (cation efflux family)
MAGVFSPGRAKIDARTLRTDRWWLQPTITVAVLVAFIIYATFRAFEAKYYFAEPLISPFYSP